MRVLLQKGKERSGAALQQGAAGRRLLLLVPALVLTWEAVVVAPLGGPGPSDLPSSSFPKK